MAQVRLVSAREPLQQQEPLVNDPPRNTPIYDGRDHTYNEAGLQVARELCEPRSLRQESANAVHDVDLANGDEHIWIHTRLDALLHELTGHTESGRNRVCDDRRERDEQQRRSVHAREQRLLAALVNSKVGRPAQSGGSGG